MKSTKDVMKILKKVRKQSKLSADQVAEYLREEFNIDLSYKTIYGWEEGNSNPSVECFVGMCKMYGITDIYSLFYDVNEGSKPDLVREKLYNAYSKNPDMQDAVDKLLDI